jgi:hypothetical protein
MQRRLEASPTYKAKHITVHVYHPGEPTQNELLNSNPDSLIGFVRSAFAQRPEGMSLNSKALIALIHGLVASIAGKQNTLLHFLPY